MVFIWAVSEPRTCKTKAQLPYMDSVSDSIILDVSLSGVITTCTLCIDLNYCKLAHFDD